MLFRDEAFMWSRPNDRSRITELSLVDFRNWGTAGQASWLPAPIGSSVPIAKNLYSALRPMASGLCEAIPGIPEEQRECIPLDHARRKAALKRFIGLSPRTGAERESGAQKEVVEFVREFGLLGLPMGDQAGMAALGVPEPLRVWLYCARELRVFREIALVARRSRFSRVKFTRLGDRDFMFVDIGDGRSAPWLVDSEGRDPHLMRNAGYGLLAPEASRDDREGAVIRSLQAHLQTWLEPLVSWQLGYSFRLSDGPPRFMEVGLKPTCLLGALWLTVTDELNASFLERTCPGCGEPFSAYDVSQAKLGRMPRSDLTCCSGRCSRRVSRKGEGPRQMKKLANQHTTSAEK